MFKYFFVSNMSLMWWSVEDIVNAVQSAVFNLLILLDSVIFGMINVCYQIFLLLCRVRIFSDEVFGGFLSRFYVLVGVLTLFFMAYSLLKVIANPDNMTKGNIPPSKLIMNVITSIALVALLPSLFNFAYKVQGVILDNNLIGKIIFDSAPDANGHNEQIRGGGRAIAVTLWNAFFYADDGNEQAIIGEDGSTTLAMAKQQFADGDASFAIFCNFSANAALSSGDEGKVHYRFFLSAIVAAFAVYVVFSFVFDVGIRAVKLAVLQIMAPLPILMRIIPGKDGVFKKWTSITIGTFTEVFVRIFVVYMIAFLAGHINDLQDSVIFDEATFPVKMMALAFLMMGVIAFARQAPKMISDILGIKAGDMKLGGIRDKLREGGGFVAGGALGGAATTGTRRLVEGAQNYHATKGQGFKKRAAAAVKGIGSVAAGTVSSGVRGGFNARNAKTYADVAQAASQGVNATEKARLKRQNEIDAARPTGTEGIAKTAKNLAKNRYDNMKKGIKNWAFGETTANLQARRERFNKYIEPVGAVVDTIKKDMEEKSNSYVVDTYKIQRDAAGNVLRDADGKVRVEAVPNQKRLLSHLQKELEQINNEVANFSIESYVNAAPGRTRAQAEAYQKELLGLQQEKQIEYQKSFDEALKTQIQHERGMKDASGQVIASVKFDAANIVLDNNGVVTAGNEASNAAHVANIDVKIEAANQTLTKNKSEIIQIATAMRDDGVIKADELTQIVNSLNDTTKIYDKKLKSIMSKIINDYDKEIYKRHIEEKEKKDK